MENKHYLIIDGQPIEVVFNAKDAPPMTDLIYIPYSYPPALLAPDAQFTDAAQLSQWRLVNK